jgi:hypothetical protein
MLLGDVICFFMCFLSDITGLQVCNQETTMVASFFAPGII